MFMRILFSQVKEFASDDDASITIEYIFMIPILVWAYIGTFTAFDAFRMKNTNITAAFTISDMLSRNEEAAPIDQAYLDGMNAVFDSLTRTPGPTWIRVTSFRWDESESRFRLHWSRATNGQLDLTQEDLEAAAGKIPAMADNSYAILVETAMSYEPISGILGLGTMSFDNFVVTSMRFAPKLCFVGTNDCSV